MSGELQVAISGGEIEARKLLDKRLNANLAITQDGRAFDDDSQIKVSDAIAAMLAFAKEVRA